MAIYGFSHDRYLNQKSFMEFLKTAQDKRCKFLLTLEQLKLMYIEIINVFKNRAILKALITKEMRAIFISNI